LPRIHEKSKSKYTEEEEAKRQKINKRRRINFQIVKEVNEEAACPTSCRICRR
jgi:hypothetical protein